MVLASTKPDACDALLKYYYYYYYRHTWNNP